MPRQKNTCETSLISVTQLSDFMNYVPGAMYQYRVTPSGNGVFDFASEGISDIFGCKAEEAMMDQQVVLDAIHPDDLDDVFSVTFQVAKEGGLWDARFRVNHPEYGLIWVQGYSRAESLEDGSVRFHGHFRDVSEEESIKQTAIHYQEQTARNNRLLESIFDHMPAGLWLVKPDGSIPMSNRWFQENYQVDRMQQSVCQEGDRDAFESEETIVREEEITFSDGEVHTVRSVKVPLKDDADRITGLLGIGMDITDYKQIEEALHLEKEMFRTTLMSLGDGVIATDNKGRVTLMNRMAEKLTGFRMDEATGEFFDKVFYIINEHTREKCDSLVYKILKTGENSEMEKDKLLKNKYGKEIPVEDSAAPIRSIDGGVKGAVIVFRDHTVEKERIRQIEYLSFHDQLTDLYNRRFLEEELNRLNTERNFPLSVLILDVNGLKLLNDAFGHAKGDELLRKVAKTIRQQCRADDIIARVGGDEFTIVLPKTDPQEVEIIVERISEGLKQFNVGGLPITASFGFETKFREEEPTEHILRKAEEKMYRQKIADKQKIAYQAVETIMQTFFDSFPNEEEHAERVGLYAEMIGTEMGVDRLRIQELKTAGLVHDIGKVALPLEMMVKADRLSEDEREEIERHPEVGYNILNAVNQYGNLSEIVLAHHEKWDGSGYPKGLKKQEIPLEARIIAVAEAYETMTTKQAYREAMPEEDALAVLQKESGRQFDPEVVAHFLSIREP
ncbi:HD domain-containing phosphohydrolase [Salisediminibacterium beveridgei]|uniref:Diguanylate cyclase (GGDEF) with PAS/PAC sensor domain(S) and HD metal dependent phosphohydrolase motif n=1 Tax=Salisediminibacterium beveridgei TaxID=632773 RepID=A0A1D7QXU9_9BACI|nr:HD domain-containing phosphohydrolase [Salisediminibacterium beveridgei]AOM83832.1 diguanylate cyclase (GGDEF) with PAS/PAC sensor domain(s) and HD metal dependent phosphohydrolase motif [Salisediminibacterium beveridgei]